jgi:hypothetical protein
VNISDDAVEVMFPIPDAMRQIREQSDAAYRNAARRDLERWAKWITSSTGTGTR